MTLKTNNPNTLSTNNSNIILRLYFRSLYVLLLLFLLGFPP